MKPAFAYYHPLTCFIYYLGAVILLMVNRHPLFLMAGIIVVIAVNLTQDHGQTLRRWLWGLLVLFAFFMVINPLVNHRGSHILGYVFGNPLTLESLLKGLMLALSLLAILIIVVSYQMIITGDKFLFLFSRVVPQWALLAMITMRFVPLFRRRMAEIQLVQKAKGLTVSEGRLRERAANGMRFVQILLTWSLEEAIQTADSMTARGYGLAGRTRYIPYQLRGKDYFAIIYMIILAGLSLYGCYLGDGRLALYPVLETVWLSGREWLYFIIFIAYLALPLGIEGREVLRWMN